MKMYHADESGISIIDTSGPAHIGPVVKNQDGIQRDVLLSALKRALQVPAVQIPTNLLKSEHLLIQNKQVIAYVGGIVISIPLGIDTGLEVTILASSLCRVLTDIPEDEITLQLNQDGNLVVLSESTQASVVGGPVEAEILALIGSPNLDGLKEEKWQELPEGFTDAINLCLFSASKYSAEVAYNCLRVYRDKIVTTDNLRISRYMFSQPKADMDFLIPIDSAKELLGRFNDEVQVDNSWAHFRSWDGFVVSTRTIVVPFPECDKFFEMPGNTVELPEGLSKALEHVLVFSPGKLDEARRAELHFEKGKIVCAAEDKYGRIERTVPAPGLEPPANLKVLRINPLFFIEILKHVTKMKVNKDGNRVLFKAGQYEHVMNLPRT